MCSTKKFNVYAYEEDDETQKQIDEFNINLQKIRGKYNLGDVYKYLDKTLLTLVGTDAHYDDIQTEYFAVLIFNYEDKNAVVRTLRHKFNFNDGLPEGLFSYSHSRIEKKNTQD